MPERLNILFTGASSFSGFWFAKTLAEAGHLVFCPLTKNNKEDYSGIRKMRVSLLLKNENIRPIWNCPLTRIVENLANQKIDFFCSHAADTGDYKSPSFDPVAAAAKNTSGFESLFPWLRERGCKAALHTGTYFEAGEGTGGGSKPAFSLYAVSKTISWELTRYFAYKNEMSAGKFVMSNPFGPYEERGFTTYLAQSWLRGETPTIKTPEYVRDNMPITLMAEEYSQSADTMFSRSGRFQEFRFTPSGFIGTQEDFALNFASKLSSIWGKRCLVNAEKQENWSEPKIRKNSEKSPPIAENNLTEFWNLSAKFYSSYVRTML